MKRLLIALSLLASSTALADKVVPNSVTVHNWSNDDRELWVNAVAYTVSSSSSLRVGCYEDESIEVQVGSEVRYVICGSQVELN